MEMVPWHLTLRARDFGLILRVGRTLPAQLGRNKKPKPLLPPAPIGAGGAREREESEFTMSRHTPVLLKEIITALGIRPNGDYLDGTVGGGGHAQAILAELRTGRVLGLDRDPLAIERLVTQRGPKTSNFLLINASYDQTPEVVRELGWSGLDGALLDLGLSSLQLDDAARGLSFRLSGPLDLRFNQSEGRPAAELLKRWSVRELADILERYGELRRTQTLARQIKAFGPILTTDQLVQASGLVHPRRLSQLFQAIRIATNNELLTLERGLPAIWSVLSPTARLAVISFQSLEDRIVKHFFIQQVQLGQGQLLEKKPITTSAREQASNPRSRSAKLRVIEKLVV